MTRASSLSPAHARPVTTQTQQKKKAATVTTVAQTRLRQLIQIPNCEQSRRLYMKGNTT
jgi:hypothetical protein